MNGQDELADHLKSRLRLPSAARLRGLFYKTPLAFLTSVPSVSAADCEPTTAATSQISVISESVSERSESTSTSTSASDEEVVYRSRGIDPANCLPFELMLHILGHLNVTGAMQAMQVNRQWHQLSTTNAIWRELYLDHEHWGVSPDLPPGLCWHRMYKLRKQLDDRWKNKVVDAKVLEGHNESVYCVQFDEHKVVTGSRDCTIRVWDAKSGQLIKALDSGSSPTMHHNSSVLCLSYDHSIMVTGSSDASCIIWDVAKLEPLQRVWRHTDGVLEICIDDTHVVTCSKDSTLCVWDRQTLEVKWRFIGHRGPVNAIDMQGDYVVSAGGDKTIRLWNLTTGTCIQQFLGHTHGLACVQLCLKTRRIVSGGNDYTIRIWDLDSAKCLYILEGHRALVRSVHLANGRIISGSYDQTIKVWDLHTGQLISSFDGLHGSWIFSAKADAKRIITTSMGVKPVILNFCEGLDSKYLEYIR